MVEITYRGLWFLWEDVALECARIEEIEPKHRTTTDKLSLPYLFRERARLWDKIHEHPYAKLNRREGMQAPPLPPKE